MKYFIIFLSLTLLSFTFKKENIIKYDLNLIDNNQIAYNKFKKMDWTFFEKRQKSNQIAAITESGITYSVEIYGEKVKVNVVCFLNKNGSYFTDGNNKPHILNHEQRHFDLSYIYTIRFMRQLQNQEDLTLDKIDYIYNVVSGELSEIENKYDLETKNSRDFDVQNKWNNFIDNELQKL